MSVPQQIPSVLLVEQDQQPLVLEFDMDIPPSCKIITLTFFNSNDELSGRVPVEKIGPRSIKALLPTFHTSGVYTVVPKLDMSETPRFPRFNISVLSQIEALQYLITQSSTGTDHLPFIAALIAYIIQMEQLGKKLDPQIIDNLLFRTIPKIENPLSFDLSFLSGLYSQDSLLHFALRQKLVWTSDWLSKEEIVGENKDKLSLNSYDGQTSVQLAMNAGFIRTATSIEKQISNYNKMHESPNDDDTEEKLEDQIKKLGSIIAKVGRNKIKKIKKAINKPKSKADEEQGGIYLAESFLQQLKITALYSALVISPYKCSGSLSGNVELNVGDFVFVVREEANNMCKGIVHDNKYCEFPLDILHPISERSYQAHHHDRNYAYDDDNNYVSDDDTENSDVSHDYEEMTIENMSPVPHRPPNKMLQNNSVRLSNSFESGLNQVSNTTPAFATYSPQIPYKSIALQKPAVASRIPSSSAAVATKPVQQQTPTTYRPLPQPPEFNQLQNNSVRLSNSFESGLNQVSSTTPAFAMYSPQIPYKSIALQKPEVVSRIPSSSAAVATKPVQQQTPTTYRPLPQPPATAALNNKIRQSTIEASLTSTTKTPDSNIMQGSPTRIPNLPEKKQPEGGVPPATFKLQLKPVVNEESTQMIKAKPPPVSAKPKLTRNDEYEDIVKLPMTPTKRHDSPVHVAVPPPPPPPPPPVLKKRTTPSPTAGATSSRIKELTEKLQLQ